MDFKSIRSKLTYWFLILAFIPLIATLIITYFQRVSVIEQQTFDKLTAIRDLKINRLNDWLSEREGDILSISHNTYLKNIEPLVLQNIPNEEQARILTSTKHILNDYLKNYDAYHEFHILNPYNGEIVVSTKEYLIGEDRSDEAYYKVPMASMQMSIIDVHYSDLLNDFTMSYAMPLRNENDFLIGILIANIDLKKSLFEQLLERVGLGETGETLIVNKDVYALNDLRWYDKEPLTLKISAEPAVQASLGHTGITITQDYRGEDILAAYSYIPRTKWGFVCKQDMVELNKPIREMVLNFIFIFVISSIGIALIALRISKSISLPIVEMDKVAKSMKAGDFSARNHVYSSDELGALALEFNNMAEITESRIKVQKGIANISETMIGKANLKEFANALLKQFMDITDSDMSSFHLLNENNGEYEHYASIGMNQDILLPFSSENPEGDFGNVISTKKIHHQTHINSKSKFRYKTIAGDVYPNEIISIPITIEDHIVAIISLVSLSQFTKETLEILKQSISIINTSYSNLVASERTRVFADHLTRVNQKLEAQSEELQNQAEELRRTSDELQEQNIELDTQRKHVEAANSLKSEFLSNMSHELRTPLNSIMALSRVLLSQTKHKLDDEEFNYLEVVERNGKRLLTLINDILDLSKIEAGKMEMSPSIINVKSSIQIVKENLQSLATDKGLKISLRAEKDTPQLETDESRLHQILTNIISNAIKFTEKGSIKIGISHTKNNISIAVSDTGIGIAKEHLATIFDEFRQVDGSSSRAFEGTGLGLAIANKLTQILGGNLSVESQLGKGTTFTITLPLKFDASYSNMQDLNIKNFNEKLLKSSESDLDTKKLDSNPSEIHLLMVEDNKEAIVQVKSVLEKESYKVSVAEGGQPALDFISDTIPDGIILDLMMPDIDGFQVLEDLRSKEQTKNIPVLILTAKDLTSEDLARLSSNNIQQLIHKGDIDVKGLLRKVNSMFISKTIKSDQTQSITTANSPKNSGVKNVLIVEDNPDNMITLKAILNKKYHIMEATDGKEGLNYAQTYLPDLILLDISIPTLSGEEIVKILKEDESTKHIPVIAVTAQAMKGDKESLLNMGCDGYVSKPIDQVILMNEIERFI